MSTYTRIFILCLVIVFAGCSKYEEGSRIALISKTARLTGDWELSHVSGYDDNTLTYTLEYTFRKDGSMEYRSHEDSGYYVATGKWQWLDDKERVWIQFDGITPEHYLVGDGAGFEQSWYVVRLTNREWWVKEYREGTGIRYFVKK